VTAGTFAAVLSVLAAASVLATGAAAPTSLHADLDGDGHSEQVRFAVVQCVGRSGPAHKPPCRSGERADRAVTIEGRCRDGKPVRRVVSVILGGQLDDLRIADADGRGGTREVFFDVRLTAAGIDAQVVRWRARKANCPQERVLFRYPTRPNTLPDPAGAGSRLTADASLSERSSKYRGLELQLRETFPRTGELTFKPAIRRDNLFRFDQRRGIYVRYATDVRSLT
jgi:hypothetical protein